MNRTHGLGMSLASEFVAVTQPNPHSQAPAATAPASPARRRVLIADDCDGTREVVAQILGDEYESVAFDNGSSAWERIESDVSVAALITDISMPGLDGFALMERVRKSADARVSALPVIAITGAPDNETRRRAFVCGATGLIPKPIDREQLLALIHVYIRPQPAVAAPTSAAPPDPTPVAEKSEPTAQSPPSTSIDFTPAGAEMPSPPGEFATSIQEEPSAARGTLDPAGNAMPAIPAELISIDAALQAIGAGKGDVLLPYLSVLEKRLQPLLACRAAQR